MSSTFSIIVRISALAWLIALPAGAFAANTVRFRGDYAVSPRLTFTAFAQGDDRVQPQAVLLGLAVRLDHDGQLDQARRGHGLVGVMSESLASIGAGVPAGAEVSLPGFPPAIIDGHCNLADVLAAALGPVGVVAPTPESPRGRLNELSPSSLASWRFFEGPEAMAERQLAAVKGMKPAPKIVFAIDYLFWHAYGFSPDDDHRRERFRRGLERLASLPPSTTIVVADLPDMTHAIGLMLSKPMVPSVELQEELNAALAAWASKPDRTNVLIVPLRETVANAGASKPVALGGKAYEGEASRGLLTNSGLHSTADGLIALSQEILDQLRVKGKLPELKR